MVRPDQTVHGPGEFVLYWMHNALRAHENPALDVAICLARQNGLPLLVYHALSEDYPYASDRFHSFILQGQRDVQRELSDRGIASHFHLQRDGDRGPHLRDLTRRAAVLVTEEMPVQPLVGWLERLTIRTTTPIAMVDASCIVPLPMVGRSFERAFEYRDATKHHYAARTHLPYDEQPVDVEMFDGPMPFVSMNLQDACLSKLIGQCRIDHSIAPVIDTPGGSRAGYARWEAYKAGGLARYADRRNDAADHDGPSRMSGYLHFGMVSPLRLARQANALAATTPGAKKYLDELLIWRELAFHFCFHNADRIDLLAGVPDWAQKTLQQHAGDDREKNCSWETLSRALSGDPLWDACQRSLVKHGELHNNVRMTWGKAILSWACSPGRALQLAIDLNHRYSLDGRDPSSYGGILWCFGQFDRPFQPESSIYGTIRTRDPKQHLQRIDLAKFQSVVDRPISPHASRVAVVGAGIGGLIAARTLADHGVEVSIFEKSAGVGGRIATRRSEVSGESVTFDHGAQYFTSRDPRFRRYVQSWIQDGVVEPWLGKIVELGPSGHIVGEKTGTPRYVGAPTMNHLAKHLANDLSIHLRTTVSRLDRQPDGRWTIVGDDGQLIGDFDKVIVNCPPLQAKAIVSDHSPIAAKIDEATMNPTWALMLAADGLNDLDFDGAFINEGPLSWIARDSSKPKRKTSGDNHAWVLHASSQWSAANVDRDANEVQKELIQAIETATGRSVGNVTLAMPRRWLYAIPATTLDCDSLWDGDAGIGVCGDWCGGPRIEGAFLSGMSVVGSLLRQITIDRSPQNRHVEKSGRPPTSRSV
ncbi:Deoxyribodipyrimidine photo-lyase [Rubripirellula tenax]|uniref:Deoxyribodipyrimidine photo-lyase n=2 Tax=Rubripirellula tenax TaxID=2528015 RepID=A0A5C6FIJ3_9BACT|nr:Deoxyribodipyrimidine photo-lyase [Rubripirellula tenax]